MLSAEHATLDALVDAECASGIGTAVAVYSGQSCVYLRLRGLADVERQIQVKSTTAFTLGSLSKQFVAAAIALLSLRDKLSISDDVRIYIPELPKYSATIRLHHLLHHTSGIRDYQSLAQLANRDINAHYPTRSELLALICRQSSLNFTPGTRYAYSNSGYVLLAKVVERVAGMEFVDFCARELWSGLQAAGQQYSPFKAHERARAYRLVRGKHEAIGDAKATIGANGIYASLEDLGTWHQSLRGSSSLSKVGRAIHAQGALDNGARVPYGWGLCIGTYKGLPIRYHAGGGNGIDNCFISFEGIGWSIFVLRNITGVAACRIVAAISDLLLAGHFRSNEHPWEHLGQLTTPSHGRKRIPPPGDMAGRYYSADLDAHYDLRITADSVVVSCDDKSEIFEYDSDGICRNTNRRMRLLRDNTGHVTRLLVGNRLTFDVAFDRVSSAL